MVRLFRFRLRTLLAAVAVAAIGCNWWVRELKTRELKDLRGEWKAVRLEIDGEAWNSSRYIRRFTWDGDLVVLDLYGEKLRYRVSVDRLQNPARIDAVNLDPELWALEEDRGRPGMGTYMYGVYSLRKDTLTLCFAERRPESLFDSAATGQTLLELKRVSRTPSVPKKSAPRPSGITTGMPNPAPGPKRNR